MAEVIELAEGNAAGCCDSRVPRRFDDAEAKQLSDELDILAHPIRLQILGILAQSEGHVCVCDLESALPVKQPTVSHHLRLLREAGLVDSERRGLWAYYFVRRDRLEALRQHVFTQLTKLT